MTDPAGERDRQPVTVPPMGTRGDEQVEALERDGFVIVPGALDTDTCDRVAGSLRSLHASDRPRGENDVGTVWFDDVLDVEPELYADLVAPDPIAPLLWALAGRQLQLRSLRGHYYPGAYRQHWHMDFYGFWDQASEGVAAGRGTAFNTTFYLQDCGPDRSYLQFVRGGHLARPEGLRRELIRATEENPFTRWCDEQELVTIYPRAGDCVVFYSHIPHRGAKVDDAMERSNVACHYQVNPFFDGVWFLSETLGEQGTFPFAGGEPPHLTTV